MTFSGIIKKTRHWEGDDGVSHGHVALEVLKRHPSGDG